tara:strand:- start:1697 stop:1963 length:267 start_codon:yes stop_codon:yes gene_type:complete
MASRKTPQQRSLDDWTKQDWRTRDGKPAKRKGRDGKTTMARYLPDAAWKKLTPSQAKATDAKKRAASRKGKKVVANTKKARAARRRAT